MLTESQRKRLTEYVGECWHEWTYIRGSVRQELWQCSKCGEACKGVASEDQKNRTFTTWADLGVVKEAIERKGEWGYASCGFERWAYINAYLKEFPIPSGNETFDSWLFNPSRFCSLVCAWKGVK